MKIQKIVFLFIYIFVFSISLYLYYGGYYLPFEEKILDWKYRWRGPLKEKESKVVLVGISDNAFKKFGQWPFSRKIYAQLLERLKILQPSLIVFDIIFDMETPIDDGGDEAFVNAVKEAKNVILAYSILKKKVLSFDNASGNFKTFYEYLKPFPKLREAALDIGLVNAEIEPLNKDGIVRKFLYSFHYQGKSDLSLGVKVARYFSKMNFSVPHYHFDDKSNYFYLNFFDQTLVDTYTFSDIFDDSFLDKLKKLNALKDKVVIIGPSFGEKDYYYTPFGRARGMRLHADVINSILYHRFIYEIPKTYYLILWFLLILVGWYLFLKRYGAFYNLILLSFYFAVSFFVFNRFGYILDVLPVAISLLWSLVFSLLSYLYLNLWEANQQLSKRLKEIEILYDISLELNQLEMSQQDKRLKVLIEKSVEALSASRGSVMLLDPYTQMLEIKSVYGKGIDYFRKEVSLPLGEGIAGEVAITKRPLLINDVSSDERFKVFSEKDKKIKSILTVPMLSHGRVIGVLNFVNKEGKEGFSEEDLKLAVTISQQAANIIENARLYREATVDGMTGLFVHRYFKNRLKEEIQRARRYDKPLSLIMTDVDHFKSFNDTYGHQIGDFVLKGVANIIKEAVRDIDVPARYGGEEFIVILPETDSKGAYILAERIRKKIESTDFKTSKGNLKVTISIGVSTFPDCGTDKEDDFVKTADEALYTAKETGRNKTVVYGQENYGESVDKRD